MILARDRHTERHTDRQTGGVDKRFWILRLTHRVYITRDRYSETERNRESETERVKETLLDMVLF